MEQDMKQTYLAPTTQVFVVLQESVICVSGTREGYGEAIEDEWA